MLARYRTRRIAVLTISSVAEATYDSAATLVNQRAARCKQSAPDVSQLAAADIGCESVMRYLEHVTTDGERWDNLAGAITAMRCLRTHHRGQSARVSLFASAVRRAADHSGYQRHANDPGATAAMAEITVSGGVSP